MTDAFYDELTSRYHLVYRDWERAIELGAAALDEFIRGEWPGCGRRILDAAAGIGTQALGLAALGYDVTASDLSANSIARATAEARARGLDLRSATADLRALSAVHPPHDLVLAWDNAIPHLLTDGDIALAMREMRACLVPGGGCLLSVRDYDAEARPNPDMIAHGVRTTDRGRTAVFQVRDWDGDHYDLSFVFVEDLDGACNTCVIKGARYYAVSIDRLLELMTAAGFTRVRRVDGRFWQPAIIGTRPD